MTVIRTLQCTCLITQGILFDTSAMSDENRQESGLAVQQFPLQVCHVRGGVKLSRLNPPELAITGLDSQGWIHSTCYPMLLVAVTGHPGSVHECLATLRTLPSG